MILKSTKLESIMDIDNPEENLHGVTLIFGRKNTDKKTLPIVFSEKQKAIELKAEFDSSVGSTIENALLTFKVVRSKYEKDCYLKVLPSQQVKGVKV